MKKVLTMLAILSLILPFQYTGERGVVSAAQNCMSAQEIDSLLRERGGETWRYSGSLDVQFRATPCATRDGGTLRFRELVSGDIRTLRWVGSGRWGHWYNVLERDGSLGPFPAPPGASEQINGVTCPYVWIAAILWPFGELPGLEMRKFTPPCLIQGHLMIYRMLLLTRDGVRGDVAYYVNPPEGPSDAIGRADGGGVWTSRPPWYNSNVHLSASEAIAFFEKYKAVLMDFIESSYFDGIK